jgi:hypothetical protein
MMKLNTWTRRYKMPKLNRHEITELVLEQIAQDMKNWDFTAIEELLQFVPLKNLKGFLPEEIVNAKLV